MFKEGHLIFNSVNLILLALALFFLFRKPVLKFLSRRSRTLKERKMETASSLKNAGENNKKYYEQLQNINQLMQNIMDQAEIEGEKEGQRKLRNIEKLADRIISQSMTRADHEVKKRNVEFYKHIAEQSVAEAENLIKKRLTPDRQIEIAKAFLNRLSGEKWVS